MSPQPRISRAAEEATERKIAAVQLTDQLPAEGEQKDVMISETSEPLVLTLKDIGASDTEIEKYETVDAIIAARQREVAAAQAESKKLTARDASLPDTVGAMPAPTTLANEIAAAAAIMAAEDAAVRETWKNTNRVANRPVIDKLSGRLAAVKAAFKKLRAEHLINVTELANMDFLAARRRIPLRITEAGVNLDNHQVLALLIRTADTARLGLTTTFREAERLEGMLEGVIDSTAESALFRSTYGWCEREVAALETSLAAVKAALATVEKFSADALTDIQIAKDATVVAPPPPAKEYLPPMPPPPPPPAPEWDGDVRTLSEHNYRVAQHQADTYPKTTQEGFSIKGPGHATVLEPVSDPKSKYTTPTIEEVR
jgi:hypothetical protein